MLLSECGRSYDGVFFLIASHVNTLFQHIFPSLVRSVTRRMDALSFDGTYVFLATLRLRFI